MSCSSLTLGPGAASPFIILSLTLERGDCRIKPASQKAGMKSNVQPLFLNHFSGEMSDIPGLETYRQLHLWGQIQNKRWPSRLLFLTLYIQQTFIDFINSIRIYWPNSVRTLGLQKVIKPRKLTHQHRHLQYRRNIARVVVLKYMNTNPKKASWRRVHMPESWRTKKIVLLEETRDKSVQAKIAKGAQT